MYQAELGKIATKLAAYTAATKAKLVFALTTPCATAFHCLL